MPKKKLFQHNNNEDYTEFLTEKQMMEKIREIVKNNLSNDKILTIPIVKQYLMSEHYEEFRKKQYDKLEFIYKDIWYRYKFYGFLEKDEFGYSFEEFFDLVYDNTDKKFNLEHILDNDEMTLEVFHELGLKNEL